MERYSAKGYVSKPDKNKGAKKQEAWTESLQELTEKPGIDQTTKQFLVRIAAQPNVPRKKPKFINFLKNCLRIDARRSEALWNIIEKNLDEFNKKTSAEEQPDTPPQVDQAASSESNEIANGNIAVVNGSGANGCDTDQDIKSKWIEIIANALSQPDLDTPIRKALKKLRKLADIPENVNDIKKKKFIKFVQRALELEPEAAKSVWLAFEASRSVVVIPDSTHPPKSPKKRKHSENAVIDTPASTVKGKKKKKTNGCANGVVDANGNSEPHEACDLNNSAFDWERNISKVFKKHKQHNELDLSFIKSKVLKKYSKENEAANASLSHIEKKITKVIEKIDKFVVEDDIVKLRES